MTIFTIAAVLIVIGWFAITALFWASFNEDEQVHPIYRYGVARDPMCQDESVKEKSNHCECNVAGDRPKRALYVKKGRVFCARCEKPVDLCPICGALRDRGGRSPFNCENGVSHLDGNMAVSRHRREAAG